MKTAAYVYRWVHIPTGKWYIGSRTKPGCHPNDGYYCSSKVVRPLIIANPEEWRREILATGSPIDMYHLETKLLQDGNAKYDANSFNQHNNDKRPVRSGTKHTEKSVEKMKGPRLPYGPQSPDHIEKRASKKRGTLRPDLSTINKTRIGKDNPNYGKTQSTEWKLKNSLANRGPKEKTHCPHCGAEGGIGIMKRWHFNNCKQKKDNTWII